ncbi:MAG TPA: hypothetical protein PK052_00095 [Anaerohalosphaeraceae bacterium]|nr:hypothetical protein [Phycisphaerae bacterium]HOK96101.1 hypothetical protein [Anaerohalosphaeraceae bacterium]HOL30354.1 hypothetical protein [Anaerohalosphaeraceae bacterium]HOM76718.1 hypothetical protein [Anaerohalosphaeraceae bacterium]HPC63052.1 hypothetical protein [Anaerohalosphaeraceae bacterium]
MKTKQLLMPSILSGIIVLAGCVQPGQPLESAVKPAQTEMKTDGMAAKRFQEPQTEGPTVIESAIELSKKYAALSEEMTKLQLEKQALAAENSRLKEQVAALEPQLAQTQKELSEANDLLVEMRIELNNWKADVLGFREEMRQADKAQLEALIKILEILNPQGTEAEPNSASVNPKQETAKHPAAE